MNITQLEQAQQNQSNLTAQKLKSDASVTYEEYQEMMRTKQNGFAEEQRNAILEAFEYADTRNEPSITE